MRMLLLRLLAILTAVMWLWAFGRAVPIFTHGKSIGGFIPIALIMCGSIVAALYSVVRPTRFAAITLVATSSLPAGFLAYETISRFAAGGIAYVRRGVELVSLPSAICFIALPFVWSAAYWSLRKRGSRPNQSLEPTAGRRDAQL
jgi:hypothetical protein